MFEALIDPYDNSGQVGDGNLINNMELAAAAIYFQILGGSFGWKPDSSICSAQLPLFVTTPRHLEANALAQIVALREAHPFEIVAKKPRELPLSLANLVERCGLIVHPDNNQFKEEGVVLIQLLDPSERALLGGSNGDWNSHHKARQRQRRLVFLYQPGEEEIAGRGDLRLMEVGTWPTQMTMLQLLERLRDLVVP